MAEVMDPNLVKMGSADFSWISAGVKNGMEFAQAKAELEYKREALATQGQQTEQQKALLNFQIAEKLGAEMQQINDTPAGPYKKSLIKGHALRAQQLGLVPSPEYLSYLEDDSFADERTMAINSFMSMTPMQKATIGKEGLMKFMSSTQADKVISDFNSMTKQQQEQMQLEAQMAKDKALTDKTIKETEIIPGQENREWYKARTDRMKAQSEGSTKIEPFIKPIRDFEVKATENVATLKTALANFRKQPNSGTRQQLAVALGRAGGDSGLFSNLDIKAYNLSTLGQDVKSFVGYITSKPNSISEPVFNNLVRMAENVVKDSGKRRVQAVGGLLKTQVNAHPELMDIDGKKHPILLEYERRLGVEFQKSPDGPILMKPKAQAPVEDKRAMLLRTGIERNMDLGMINKGMGLRKFKPATQQEIDALKKKLEADKKKSSQSAVTVPGNRAPASAEDLLSRNSELTQKVLGTAQAQQGLDSMDPIEASAVDSAQVPTEEETAEFEDVENPALEEEKPSFSADSLPADLRWGVDNWKALSKEEQDELIQAIQEQKEIFESGRGPSSQMTDEDWLENARIRAKKLGLELVPVKPVREPKEIPVESKRLRKKAKGAK